MGPLSWQHSKNSIEIIENIIDIDVGFLAFPFERSFGDQFVVQISIDGHVHLKLLDKAKHNDVFSIEVVTQASSYLVILFDVSAELEDLTRRTCYLFDEVQSVTEMQGFVVGVVTGISLFQEEGPELDCFALLICSHDADVDEEGDLKSFRICYGRNIVIHYHILPHVFLEDPNQIDSQITHFLDLEYRLKKGAAIFNSGKGISNEVVADLPTIAVYFDIASSIRKDAERFSFEEFRQTHPSDVVSLKGFVVARTPSSVDGGYYRREQLIFVFLIASNMHPFSVLGGEFCFHTFQNSKISLLYDFIASIGPGLSVLTSKGAHPIDLTLFTARIRAMDVLDGFLPEQSTPFQNGRSPTVRRQGVSSVVLVLKDKALSKFHRFLWASGEAESWSIRQFANEDGRLFIGSRIHIASVADENAAGFIFGLGSWRFGGGGT